MKLRKFNATRESKKLSNKQQREYQVKTRTMILSIGILICSIILCTYAAFSSTNKVDVMKSNVGNLVQEDYEIKAYINNTLSNTLPDKTDGYTIDNITCTNGATGEWNDVDWGILITDAEEPTVCSVYFVEYEDDNEFDYTGNVQTFKVPRTGSYKIELWGAQGGSSTDVNGGLGGYVSGIIDLDMNDDLYFYVGGEGDLTSPDSNNTKVDGGYNGGGSASNYQGIIRDSRRQYGSGGGATDVRTVGGNWNDFASLKSRIMVAGAGGGAFQHSENEGYYSCNGGSAGGLVGNIGDVYAYNENHGISTYTGGTQTAGGYAIKASNGTVYDDHVCIGKFGYAQSRDNTGNSGAGSGYYAGGGSWHIQGSGGGSSFISGYSGCDAITESSTENNIVHTGQPNHYSGNIFTNGVMIDGSGCNWSTGSATNCGTNQIQPDGTYATGHSGDGYAKITLLSLE